MAGQLSCSSSRATRSTMASMRAGQGVGPALVAGGAVGAGQLVEPLVERSGVAHVAAHGAVGPAPIALVVAVEAQVQLDQAVTRRRCPRSGSAGPASAPGSCGPRPPRGGGTTPCPPARTSGSSACRRRGRGRPAARSARAGSARPRRWCGPARPCGGGSGPARGARPGSSGRNSSARPVSTRNHRPGAGALDDQQLVELHRGSARRTTISSRSCSARTAATTAVVGGRGRSRRGSGRPAACAAGRR